MTEPVLNEIQTAIDQLSHAANLGGFRRQEDHERLSKLEYIVADHHVDLQTLKESLNLVKETSQETIANLKSIKYILIGAFVGMSISTIGVDKMLGIIRAFVGIL
jgi:hypothetical protein